MYSSVKGFGLICPLLHDLSGNYMITTIMVFIRLLNENNYALNKRSAGCTIYELILLETFFDSSANTYNNLDSKLLVANKNDIIYLIRCLLKK